MEKFNRKIDEFKMEVSKDKTIDNVMERINNEKAKEPFFSYHKSKIVLLAMSLVIVIAFILAPNLITPIEQTTTTEPIITEPFSNVIKLNDSQTKTLVETSYMSASIISNALSATTTSPLFFMPLADQEVEFEKNIDEFNRYFNMLKVFIDQDNFLDTALIEELTDSEFNYKITYTVNNKTYNFFLNITEENEITGEITINQEVYTVEGEIEENNEDFTLYLKAYKDDSYIIIEYNSETDDEIEETYILKQNINSIYIEREINIEKEDDEVSVEIIEGENHYLLEKFSENGVTVYFLEYEVNNIEGEVYITESIDEFGKTHYNYHISEGDLEKEIDMDDPDEDDDDDEENDEDDDLLTNNLKETYIL